MRSKFVILCMMTVVPTNSVAHLTSLSPSKCCRYKVREPLTETYVANFFDSMIMMIMVVRIVIMVMTLRMLMLLLMMMMMIMIPPSVEQS